MDAARLATQVLSGLSPDCGWSRLIAAGRDRAPAHVRECLLLACVDRECAYPLQESSVTLWTQRDTGMVSVQNCGLAKVQMITR